MSKTNTSGARARHFTQEFHPVRHRSRTRGGLQEVVRHSGPFSRGRGQEKKKRLIFLEKTETSLREAANRAHTF